MNIFIIVERFQQRIKSFSSFYLLVLLLFASSSCIASPQVHLKKKYYFFAIPSRWQYISFYEADKNIAGFLSDFALSLAKEGEFEVKLVFIDPEEIPTLLANKTIDACFTDEPKNYVTEQKYLFSRPIFINGTVIVVSQKSSFYSVLDLKNTELAFDTRNNRVLGGGSSIEKEASTWFLRPYNNLLKALDQLDSGKIDGVIANYMQVRQFTSSLFESRYRVLFPPIVSENITLMIGKNGEKELIDIVNSFQKRAVESGAYKDLLSYWKLNMPTEREPSP